MSMKERLSSWLDRGVRPELRLIGRSWPAFHVCGLIGWATGISLALLLTWRLGLGVWVTAVLALGSIATFLGLIWVTRALAGEEVIIYYHHEIAVALVSSILLGLLRQPLLPYLDVVFMGLGTFLACGRVGCLMVGCCHGRPGSWGVCYRQEHAEAGFPRPLVGVRLIPIQLVESLFVAGTVAAGTVLMIGGAAPGSALALYSIVYGLGRFGFELVRGDAARPYFGSFSEAQWTTLVLMSTTAVAELTGVLPLSWWHLAAAGGLAAAMAVLATMENSARQLFRPRHVRQMAELIEAARSRTATDGRLHVGETSLGIRISASTVQNGEREAEVFAFSCRDGALPEETARRLAHLICQLRHASPEADLVKGSGDIYHLILPVQRSAYAL